MLIYVVLAAATCGVYWQVVNHDFVNYDDHRYVTENEYVKSGLNIKGIRWAFTTNYAADWHPLTWLSFMLDYELFDLKAGWYHLTNLFFHVANTLLLFAVLKKMTARIWCSGFVAALFALHPLHVESVAWVAERKDVLSTFFGILTMAAYAGYVQKPGPWRYLIALLLFAAGLLAKPMLVTIPFVLLLLDYWPLGRFNLVQSILTNTSDEAPNAFLSQSQRRLLYRIIREKVPFFALSAASLVVTLLVQQSYGALVSFSRVSIGVRIINALNAYVTYIIKMFWPTNLAVVYPISIGISISVTKIAAELLVLIGVTVKFVQNMRRYPYLITGWLWYLGTLVPVIGLVQVGMQTMADRYTYVPLIGLFIAVTWFIADEVSKRRYGKIILTTAAILVLISLSLCTFRQLRYWQNSETLFSHAIKVVKNNYVAQFRLASELEKQGRDKEAIEHYYQVLQISPNHFEANYQLGTALCKTGDSNGAMIHWLEAVRLNPDCDLAHYNLAVAFYQRGKLDETIKHCTEALRLQPTDKNARQLLEKAKAQKKQGK